MTEPKRDFRALDWAERLLLSIFYVWLVASLIPKRGDPEWTENFIVQLPGILGEGLLLVFIWIRRRPKDLTVKPLDWVLAFAATSSALLVRKGDVGPLLPIAVIVPLHFSIFFLQLYAKLSLGLSFGVVPANRGIQSDGLYRFVRHPIYASYLAHHLVFWFLVNPSWLNAMLFVVVYSLQIPRLLAEEKLLSQDADYVAYAQKVKYRLIPGVF